MEFGMRYNVIGATGKHSRASGLIGDDGGVGQSNVRAEPFLSKGSRVAHTQIGGTTHVNDLREVGAPAW